MHTDGSVDYNYGVGWDSCGKNGSPDVLNGIGHSGVYRVNSDGDAYVNGYGIDILSYGKHSPSRYNNGGVFCVASNGTN